MQKAINRDEILPAGGLRLRATEKSMSDGGRHVDRSAQRASHPAQPEVNRSCVASGDFVPMRNDVEDISPYLTEHASKQRIARLVDRVSKQGRASRDYRRLPESIQVMVDRRIALMEVNS